MSIYQELAYNRVTCRVNSIQFNVHSASEIVRRSVVEVTENQAFTGNDPVPNGLFDPRMGVIDNNRLCATCNQSNMFCPGHFGHIVLARPVFWIQFMETVKKILRCVCFRCSSLLIDIETNTYVRSISNRKISRQRRWELMNKICQKVRRCGQDNTGGCGAKLPDKISKTEHFKIKLSWKNDIEDVILSAEDVCRILCRISDEDSEAIGFSAKYNRPENMICKVLPVPPPAVRPSVVPNGGQRQEDDLTHKLSDIIKFNNKLKEKIASGVSFEDIDGVNGTCMIQYHVSTLIDNSTSGMYPAQDRAGRTLRSLSERLRHKEGRIRGNLMGKRVDFSARTVITPDPNLSVDELGVPIKIAMNLTFPEIVNSYNIDRLNQYILSGPDIYPGAKQIRIGTRTIRLKNHPDVSSIQIKIGDVVERHLINGDYVLFNRQPSLHKMSMMAHRIRVMPYNTFRLNVCVCSSYNADFDGDEMNMHVPQSIQSHYEIKKLAAVPYHILSPKTSTPIVSIVQDVALGVYRLTRKDVQINRRDAFNLLCIQGSDNSIQPIKEKFVTGRRIMSSVIPSNVRVDMKRDDENIVIRQGNIISGQLTTATFNKGSVGLVHTVHNTMGPDAVVDMLNATQKIVCDWLVTSGFSVGISDIILPDPIIQKQRLALQECKCVAEQIIQNVHQGTFENNSTKTNDEYFEELIKDTSHPGVEKVRQLSLEYASKFDNRMLNMIHSGSKGKEHNFLQMTGCLGQQDIEGKRVAYGFDGRTLPHFTKFDDSPKSRGFIENSFIQGLDPHEFFFHSMAGRIGLINTAVRTSETGYLQRRLIKAMEDCKIAQDYTVRNANNFVVQFIYGEDGIDATKLERHKMKYVEMTETEMEKQYFLTKKQIEAESKQIQTRLSEYYKKLKQDRIHIITGLCGGLQVHDRPVVYPVNIKRIVDMAIDENFKGDKISVEMILDMIDRLIKINIPGVDLQENVAWMPVIVRWFLTPKIILDSGISMKGLEYIENEIYNRFKEAIICPGEMVGIVAAQSIGEISTQLTLNTFHASGIAAFTKVTSGIPRMKELMSISKKIKTPMMHIRLIKDIAIDQIESEKTMASIQMTYFRDVVSKSWILYDDNSKDEELIQFYKDFGSYTDNKSPWVLRFELDKAKMLDEQIQMMDIELCLNAHFDKTIECILSDDNNKQLVVRLKLTENVDFSDALTEIHALEQSIMENLIIKGIQGIEKAKLKKPNKIKRFDTTKKQFEDDKEWSIVTNGTNFINVLCHHNVDPYKTITNDVYEAMNVLGIEAARQILIDELMIVLDGEALDDRHLSLLADAMSNRGFFMSIDRHGINNRGELGPLAKCSFEQTTDMLIKAGIFAEKDNIHGVSANTMLGQIAPCGTGECDIDIDIEKLMKIMPEKETMDTLQEDEQYQEYKQVNTKIYKQDKIEFVD